MRLLLAICLTTILVLPAHAAQSPLATLRTNTNIILNILQDPQYTKVGMKKKQGNKLIIEMNNMFDFSSFARGALGHNWKRFDEEQKIVFTDIFSHLIINGYLERMSSEALDKIQINYLESHELKPTKSGKKRADVNTTILYNDVISNLDYRMFDQGQGWKVYDIKIAGVSMVANYREQYRQKYNDSPNEIIEEMKTKLSELSQE
ncbi:MAG: ABC transporter substrate-binding protein [Desulfotalea sp.]